MIEENKNDQIINDLLQDKQEKTNKEIDDIQKEFPIESPTKTPKLKDKKKQPYPIKLDTSPISQFPQKNKKKFKLFKKKPQPKHQVPKRSVIKMPSPRKPKNNLKIIIPLVLIIAIFVVVFVITFKCDCPEGTDSYAQAKLEATGVLMNSIQNQIIQKGYAEIFNGDIILKLAPYTG